MEKELIWRMGPDGLEGIDPKTGQVVEVQKSKRRSTKPKTVTGKTRGRLPKNATHHTVLDGNGKKQVVPVGTDPSSLPYLHWPFNPVTADHICGKVMEGLTIRQIGLLEGFPPAHTIFHWMRKYADFSAALKTAKEARAEYFHDKVIQVADEVEVESDAAPARVKIDAYKWAAKVGDPNQYGDKTKISGDAAAPVGFVFMTGVPEPEAPAIPTTGKEVEEK